MTVRKVGESSLKISLTDKEVLSYFGAYEKIGSMSGGVKLIVSAMLDDILDDYGFTGNDKKLLVEMRAKVNYGCEITVTIIEEKSRRMKSESKDYLFEFSGSESLIVGMMYLYRNRKDRRLKSSLYKMPNTYRLIICSTTYRDTFLKMNEFCIRQSDSPYEAAYTEEYGDLLIEENAIEKFGTAFSKYF